MVVLRTLGTAELHVGAHVLLPRTALPFAALLYLVEARGKEVQRADLQELLFPELPGDAGSHRLRQILYRVRQLGAPVETMGEMVVLSRAEAQLDYERIGTRYVLAGDGAASIRRGILAGYAPTMSPAFAGWVDERRTAIQASVIRALVEGLVSVRAQGRLSDVEVFAETVYALDPLNEEATLALAEGLAAHGQKARAVKMLDEYLKEVAPYGVDIRLQASSLRRRISEQDPVREQRNSLSDPFVGRKNEVAELWIHYQRAKRNEGCVVVIHGDAGIGKTRLATEFLKVAQLDGATCLRTDCTGPDLQRPLSVFVDLVPKLLDSPGGLGVAPAALALLRRLTQANPLDDEPTSEFAPRRIFDLILEALRDLVASVSEEQPIVMLIDDAQFVDAASLDLIADFAGRHGSRRLMVLLTSRGKLLFAKSSATTERLYWQRLSSLGHAACNELLGTLLEARGPAVAGWNIPQLLEVADGNPLYLRWLVAESAQPSGVPRSASLEGLLRQQILRLSSTELRAFVAVVMLARHCQLDRLAQVAGLPETALLEIVQHLEQHGYLIANHSDIRSAHPILSHIAMEELPAATLKLMRGKAAALLEIAARPHQHVTLMWDAAELWHAEGSTARAVELLSSCAKNALGIGQPQAACKLLKRAYDIGEPSSHEVTLVSLLDAAQRAEHHALALFAISEARRTQLVPPDTVLHDDLEWTELFTTRHAGTPLPMLLPRLQQCVRTEKASNAHRLRVAPTLFACFELLMDPQTATAVYHEISDIPRTTALDTLNYLRAITQYHCFAGDNAEAITAATEALSLCNPNQPPTQLARFLADLGLALFRCGDTENAILTLESSYRLANRIGMWSNALATASLISWANFVLGDVNTSRHYEHVADTHYKGAEQQHPSSPHYFSNKIEFALSRNDPEDAGKWLALAERDYYEIATPSSTILKCAYQLRISQLLEVDRPSTLSLLQLANYHTGGSGCGMHDTFAEAYWYELVRLGRQPEADAMLLDYLQNRRKDGYPVSPRLAALPTANGRLVFDGKSRSRSASDSPST